MSQHCYRNAKAELVQQFLAANQIFLVYISESPWQAGAPDEKRPVQQSAT
jgi:hypothetical protein